MPFSDKHTYEQQKVPTSIQLGAKIQSFHDVMMARCNPEHMSQPSEALSDYERGQKDLLDELWSIYSDTFEDIIEPFRCR